MQNNIFTTKKVFGKERSFLLTNFNKIERDPSCLSENNILFDQVFYPPIKGRKRHLNIPHFGSFMTGFSFPSKTYNIELFNCTRMLCTWKGEKKVDFVNFLPLNLEFAGEWHLRYDGDEPISIYYAEMKNPKYQHWGNGEPVFTDFNKNLSYALGIVYGTCTIIPKTISLII